MGRDRHPPETVIQAIRDAHGLLAPAAKLLGYTRTTLYEYIKRHNLQPLVQEAREESLDWAELYLWKQITQGNLTAIIFFLKCLGKSRGYVERVPTVSLTPAQAALEDVADEDVIYIDVRRNGNHG